MALLFTDSFDHYQTSDIARKYNVAGGAISAGNGRNSTASLRTTAAVVGPRKYIGQKVTTIVGAAFKTTALTADAIIAFRDDTGVQMNLFLLTDGTLRARRGDGTVLGTSTSALSTGGWYYIEVLCTVANAVGVFTIHVNGVEWLALTGIDTQNSANAYATTIQLGVLGGVATWDFDDYYICDNLGGVNDTFLGDVRVEFLLPTSDIAAHQDWTASGGGSHYTMVDENPPTDDTDYVSSSTITNKDAYGMGNLVTTNGTIKGVQVCVLGRKTDAGGATIQLSTRRAAVDGTLSAEKALGTTYAFQTHPLDADPTDASTWTITTVNASEILMNRSA